MLGEARHLDGRGVLLEWSLAATAADADQNAGTAPEAALDPCAQLGEPLGRVAVPRVPAVPPIDVRRRRGEHARARGSDHQRDAVVRWREEHGVLGLVEPARGGDTLAVEEPSDDCEGFFEARDLQLRVEAESLELRVVPPRAEAEHEPP